MRLESSGVVGLCNSIGCQPNGPGLHVTGNGLLTDLGVLCLAAFYSNPLNNNKMQENHLIAHLAQFIFLNGCEDDKEYASLEVMNKSKKETN